MGNCGCLKLVEDTVTKWTPGTKVQYFNESAKTYYPGIVIGPGVKDNVDGAGERMVPKDKVKPRPERPDGTRWPGEDTLARSPEQSEAVDGHHGAAVLRSPEKSETIGAPEIAEEKAAVVGANDETFTSSAPALLPPVQWQPGKRLRRKTTVAAPATLDQLPQKLQENLQVVARVIPEPHAAQEILHSPAPTTFPARRQSIASLARRPSFGKARRRLRRKTTVVAPAPLYQSPERRLRVSDVLPSGSSPSAGASHSDSSSSSSDSSSSSSGSSSSGESEEKNAPGLGPWNQWGFSKNKQRFPTPAISDTARAFYVTLYEENPESYIATAWLVEHGVLEPIAEHNRLVKQYEAHKEQRRKLHAEAFSAPPDLA